MIRVFLAMGRVANTPQPWIRDRRRSIMKGRRASLSPESYATGVDVNEIGRGVVANASELQRTRRGPEIIQLHTGKADVDGLAIHVETMARDPRLCPAALAQHRVR